MSLRFEDLESRRLMSAPAILAFGADRSLAAVGEPVTLTVTASGAAGLAAATFFVDMNNNAWWDAGVDLPLGDAWVLNSPTQASMSKVVTPTAQWPVRATIYADVLDRARQWTGAPRGTTVGRRTAPPNTLSVTSSTQYVAPGDGLDLTVTGAGSVPLLAASFFVDVDGDRRYSRGADIPLGDVWQPLPGTQSYRLHAIVGWDWGIGTESPTRLGDQSALICANVEDVNGQWGTVAAATLVQVVPHASITSFTAIGTATNVQLTAVVSQWSAGGWGVVLPGAPNAVRSVTYFYDANRNGRFDGGDVTLGSVGTNSNAGSFGGTLTLNAATQAGWAYPRAFGAYAIDARPQGNPNSLVRSATQLGDSSDPANVKPWTQSVRQVSTGVSRRDPWVNSGDLFGITASVQPAAGSPFGLSSAIAFYDNDQNGQFEPARGDTLIEEQAVWQYGDVAYFAFPITGSGQVQVAVAARDTMGRIGEARGTVVLVATRPTIQNVATAVVIQGGGRFLKVTVDAGAGSDSIREVDATIDPRTAMSFWPVSGSTRSGRWVLMLDLSGYSSGVRTLSLRVSNFYHVDTQLDLEVMI